ncbi:DUF2818 family protein [Pelomonas sp. CA6]|uniref:DUF2818 family protein n=1 Tax=Pelomonas sp. CA6 TaxID=2907999 RepID=UPI001F4BE7CC|nr:DUF2818 family protein [Pelomonas sp. CA6]MCH7344859.1 DUF2818 family protein [Pelomonas sp. CA6]
MDQTLAVWLTIVVAVLAANAPYLTHRLGLVGPRRAPKPAGWLLLELFLMALLTLGLGFALESWQGQRAPQGWEFYAAALCLFLTLGFPGFVWRYLRRRSAVLEEVADGA